jgi:hypothetical protein
MTAPVGTRDFRAPPGSPLYRRPLTIRHLCNCRFMTYDDRASDIRALLWTHAHPALRNMDRDQIAKLAEQILRIATDRGLWTKWGPMGPALALAIRSADRSFECEISSPEGNGGATLFLFVITCQ